MILSRFICFTFTVLAASHVFAMDTALYTKLASETVQEANGGFVANINRLLKVQEQLINLGVEGSKEYVQSHPEHAELLELVIDNAPHMMKMSLDEIEEQWHQGTYLKVHGIDLDKIEHFSEVFSLMDSIIHPATSYIALREYKRTRNADYLARAAAELAEVIEHVAHIGSASHAVSSNQ